jgi:hypothetical protein
VRRTKDWNGKELQKAGFANVPHNKELRCLAEASLAEDLFCV